MAEQREAERVVAATAPEAEPCLVVVFGASGDLTKRLLVPAFYNLACDGLLPDAFAIVGIAMDDMSTEAFRDRLDRDIRQFSTRREFDAARWEWLRSRVYYTPGEFADPAAFARLQDLVSQQDARHQTRGNLLFYMATPPGVFGAISRNLHAAGFKTAFPGWKRIIVEKPFGTDLQSAIALNREILTYWSEEQIFRIDHYLGKETVQNILAFRFSNGMFEPLWNHKYIDHIQFSVAEAVGVEGRGAYYERAGVLRDMIQNHMFQMLAYLCMEPPSSFAPEAIRNEKAKVLEAVRIMDAAAVARDTVRGQYGAGRGPDGKPVPGYREEPSVAPHSLTETYAAMKLHIDNWRWNGVPIYLRSGKRLWKRGTEIIVQFQKAPEVIFRHTPVAHLGHNRLIFHIQPDQGIELRFHAKEPGPQMSLQQVNMRFDYSQAFVATRAIGYEVLVYNCMKGDATLFSRTDLVESAWRIAQPILDHWKTEPAEFPSYAAGTWGPKEAFELLERDQRRWVEIPNRETLEKVPLFDGCDASLLASLIMVLKPIAARPGDVIFRKGDLGRDMYLISRGAVDVIDDDYNVLATLCEGDFFGEIGLLLATPRTATIRARTYCDLFLLQRADFAHVLAERPHLAETLMNVANERYDLTAGVQ
ncbi:MAG: glucose-6-phosphate dehydrogenase [Candidatus Sericytochromatia bacterium]|nr:glucose-6-phosphate dehydrogenase [Candidatus Tanganyikabacteria bacterium]